MPRAGDSPLARFAYAVVHETGFCLGTPYLTDGESSVTVPVLRRASRARRCVLAHETREALSAVDVGRLDRLRVQNASGSLLFLPPGSVFVGRSTASRATTTGVLLEPSAVREIEVKCVQPSRPIHAGESLALAEDLASNEVAQALLSRDQGRVWAVVAARLASAVPVPCGPSRIDAQECGRVLLDARGVLVAEICDDPEVWAGIRREPSVGASAPSQLGLNPAKAIPLVQEFLNRLSSAAFRTASAESWVAADFTTEFTVMGDELVHLLALGPDLSVQAPGGPLLASRDPALSEARLDTDSAFVPSTEAPADGDVAVASPPIAEAMEDSVPLTAAVRPRRRKVLTSGWDPTTFESLERLSHKEFQGDRSAAIRVLVRHGLRERGYLGPQPHPRARPPAVTESEEAIEPADAALASMAARVRDYERIAATEAYADWLRKRARSELERLGGDATDDTLRSAARDALDRLPPPPLTDEAPQPEEIEAVQAATEAPPVAPSPPPVDVRPLLRRAFAASAGGQYPEALTLFDDVLTAEPDHRTALLGRAVALRRSGKAQEALDALDAVLRAEPTNAAALLNRGRLLQERGDLSAALDVFDLLATVAPNDWDVWLVRGDVLAKLGRRPEALRAYTEALRRNPEDTNLKLKIRDLETAESASVLPSDPRIPLPRDVQEGQSYLVREGRPSLSLRVLRALAARGVPALAITARSADTARRDIGLAGVRVLELTHTPGEGRHDPTDLTGLSHLVARFVQEGRGHGVIALDSLASLVRENGARETLLFIERVNEAVLQSHAVFLVSLAPDDLSDREIALLERSLRVLS